MGVNCKGGKEWKYWVPWWKRVESALFIVTDHRRLKRVSINIQDRCDNICCGDAVFLSPPNAKGGGDFPPSTVFPPFPRGLVLFLVAKGEVDEGEDGDPMSDAWEGGTVVIFS